MNPKEGFSLNFKDFNDKFKEIVDKTMPSILSRALFKTGAQIIKDAITLPPKVPKKTGTLRRSQVIDPAVISRDDISIRIGFNTDYAAAVHEAPENRNWNIPGSGPKYLSSKLSMYRDRYMAMVAELCLKESQSGGAAGGAASSFLQTGQDFENVAGGD
jgi:hypothetical protein